MQKSTQTEQQQALKQACKELELVPSPKQELQLLEYLEQLLKWNKTYNLTAIKDPDQALVHHIFDSLSIIHSIKRELEDKKLDEKNLLDVGSGAGLPGCIVAIMMPEVEVTCVDAVEKKVTFIRQIAGILKLGNLKAIHEKVEKLLDRKYSIITSRAFASLEDFANLAGDLAKPNGILLAMKGKTPNDEIQAVESRSEWKVDSVNALQVPGMDAQRCLVRLIRKGTQ